ncbi:UNVERIFIED_CONTAM: hypothetical protein Sangu_3187200 [Sesamum angustifolium]|uniref:Uncharacterized protein n=1 Tax=Sesamum angustifolium TaxID=2727405 RepID=A0AAW2JP11_9LAMI
MEGPSVMLGLSIARSFSNVSGVHLPLDQPAQGRSLRRDCHSLGNEDCQLLANGRSDHLLNGP